VTPAASPHKAHEAASDDRGKDKEKPEQAGWRGRPRSLGAFAGAITLLIAIWGAITGTIAWREGRQVSLDLSASTNVAFYPIGPPGIGTDQIRLSFVNKSARAVSVVRGDVLLGERVIGQVVSATAEVSGVGGQSTTVPFPYSVPANSSPTLELDWRTAPTAEPLLILGSSVPVSARRLFLRLVIAPGGSRTVAVLTGQQPPVIGGWVAWERVSHHRVTALLLAAAARNSGSTLGTLQVWPADPRKHNPVLTARRPAGWQIPAWFTISSLPPGGYVFSLSSGTATLVTGTLQTRCLAKDGLYFATACITGNAGATKPFVASPVPAGKRLPSAAPVREPMTQSPPRYTPQR
jgi:hypothetical protein